MASIAHVRTSDGTAQFLRSHLEGVAAYARRYAGKCGVPVMGELMGLLHDLGKYSEAFQACLRFGTGMIDPDADGEHGLYQLMVPTGGGN